MLEERDLDSDIRRYLTCWPPIDYMESALGLLAIFSLSAKAASTMRKEFSEPVLSVALSDVEFARAVARYSCFPADQLRDGNGRPSKLILTDDHCLRLLEVDIQLFCDIFLREQLLICIADTSMSRLRQTYLQRWKEEKEKQRKELQRFWTDLASRIETIKKEGIKIDNLSAKETVSLLRRPDAQESYERFRDVAAIVRNGWFIDTDFEIRHINQSAEHLRSLAESNPHASKASLSVLKEIDANAVCYFESRYENIRHFTLSRFKARGRILGPAFNAHEQGHYCLSIPVFITQADGIFKELRGFELFSSHAKEAPQCYRESLDNIKKRIHDRHEILWADFLPLLFHFKSDGVGIPLDSSTSTEPAQCERFNRHAIMHGLCSFYATKETV